MTHGISDPAGLEPADASRSVDPIERRRTFSRRLQLLQATAATLEAIHEHKAAREVRDAALRFVEEEQQRAAREGERRSEGVHGEDPQEAEVSRASDRAGDPHEAGW